MPGRKSDLIWTNYKKMTTPGKCGTRAICKKCGMELQGLVERLKKHAEICTGNIKVINYR